MAEGQARRLLRWLDNGKDLALHEGMRRLPTPWVSDLGAGLARLGAYGRHRSKIGRAVAALDHLRPDLDAAGRHDLALRNFLQIGRTMAEFSCMDRFWEEGRVEIVGRENLPGNNVILALLHLGNWEALNAAVTGMGLWGCSIYQPPSSAAQHAIAVRARRRVRNDAIPASTMAPRQALRVLGEGGLVGIFVDEYLHGRVNAPAFGRPPAPGGNIALVPRLARKAGVPVVPGFALRRPGPRFEAHFLPPVPMSGDAARDQAALEAVIEPVIRANLEQWFMLYPFRPDC